LHINNSNWNGGALSSLCIIDAAASAPTICAPVGRDWKRNHPPPRTDSLPNTTRSAAS